MIRVIDFETTGIPAADHTAAIVEVGWYGTEVDAVLGGGAFFVNTSVTIDLEARAVHHITDAEIATGISIETAFHGLMAGPPDFFCAHNAEFEQQFFAGGNVPWLDTY